MSVSERRPARDLRLAEGVRGHRSEAQYIQAFRGGLLVRPRSVRDTVGCERWDTAGGTGLVEVTSDGTLDQNPSLSADGSKVAWESDRDGNWEVYVANTDGTGLVNVSSHYMSDTSPSLQGN